MNINNGVGYVQREDGAICVILFIDGQSTMIPVKYIKTLIKDLADLDKLIGTV